MGAKEQLIKGSFTEKYNIGKLVYFENFAELYEARDREYQIKKWIRKKKEKLIEKENAFYLDLAKDWLED